MIKQLQKTFKEIEKLKEIKKNELELEIKKIENMYEDDNLIARGLITEAKQKSLTDIIDIENNFIKMLFKECGKSLLEKGEKRSGTKLYINDIKKENREYYINFCMRL